MGIADDAERVAADRQVPPEFQAHARIVGDEGTAATGLTASVIGSDDDLLRMAGLDPVEWMVTAAKKQVWSKETSRGTRRSIFFGFVRRSPERERMAVELASMITPVQSGLGGREPLGLPLVVCLSDFQCGKVDRGSGTPELSARFESVLGQLVDLVVVDPPSQLVIIDVGDAVENHASNTATSQASTNDLTLDQQLRLWQRMLARTVISLAPFAGSTLVTGVPSNHGEVRVGGQQLGHGDYGLGALGAVADAFGMLETDLVPRFLIPEPGDIAVSIPVGGATLVATHGHHARQPNRVPDWVAGQAASPSSPFARADIIVHGHFHHPSYVVSRGREIIGCPTLDGGSAWFKNSTGEWSHPGLACFRVRDGRTSDLRFLEA